MGRFVEITFDCLPLRSVGRVDIPLDASPKFRQHCENVLAAISKHGTHNTYYLHHARCVFHLTNAEGLGMLEFGFEGTALTDPSDQKTQSCDLRVELLHETCEWLTEPVVEWFADTVPRAVAAEFDLYITDGDLKKTLERIERVQSECDEHGGFVGMYL